MQDKSYLHVYDNLRCLATALLLHGQGGYKEEFQTICCAKEGRMIGQSRPRAEQRTTQVYFTIRHLICDPFVYLPCNQQNKGMNKMKSAFDHEVL